MEIAWGFDTPAPRQVVWDYLTSPVRRPKWNADDVIENSPTGRRGAGTVNHCIHGRDAIIEEILDYRPHDYWTVRSQVPQPGMPKITYSQVLEDRPDGGTHVEFRDGEAAARRTARPSWRWCRCSRACSTTRSPRSRRCSRPRPRPGAEGDGVEVPEGHGRFATEPVTA